MPPCAPVGVTLATWCNRPWPATRQFDLATFPLNQELRSTASSTLKDCHRAQVKQHQKAGAVLATFSPQLSCLSFLPLDWKDLHAVSMSATRSSTNRPSISTKSSSCINIDWQDFISYLHTSTSLSLRNASIIWLTLLSPYASTDFCLLFGRGESTHFASLTISRRVLYNNTSNADRDFNSRKENG